MFKRLIQDETVVSVSGTILVHGVLILLFLLIHINFRPVIEEFTELAFAGSWVAPPREIAPETEELSEDEVIQEEINQPLPEEIELPERRELDLNEQEIIEKVQAEPEKLMIPGNIVKETPVTKPPLPKTQTSGPTLARREKDVEQGIFQKQLDEKLLQGNQKMEIDANREFEIDWEGELKREIYQRRLPEFPPDVQREAIIKIKFTVLPNGLVGSAVILQKGETKLENLTLEAFKTWRFNPLPGYAAQVAQSGVITFRFKLR
jgi:TonB family protein